MKAVAPWNAQYISLTRETFQRLRSSFIEVMMSLTSQSLVGRPYLANAAALLRRRRGGDEKMDSKTRRRDLEL